MKVLFVEDNKSFTDAIVEICAGQQIQCDIANDGEKGLELALRPDYDLVVLDIMLPKVDGLEILEMMRKRQINTPVLMLTAKESVEDKVRSLDMGADDYLVKPVSTKELFARMRALRRRAQENQSQVFTLNRTAFSSNDNFLNDKGEQVRLSQKESKILEFLLQEPGKAFTRDEIFNAVWGSDTENENNVEIYIYNLRKKIKDTPLHIDTIRGLGYTLRTDH